MSWLTSTPKDAGQYSHQILINISNCRAEKTSWATVNSHLVSNILNQTKFQHNKWVTFFRLCCDNKHKPNEYMLNYGSSTVISDSQHQYHLPLGSTCSPGPAQTYQTRSSGGRTLQSVFRLFQGILKHTKEKSSVSGGMKSGMFLEGTESVIRLDKN